MDGTYTTGKDSHVYVYDVPAIDTNNESILVAQWTLKGRLFTEGIVYIPDGMGRKFYIMDGTDMTGKESHVYVMMYQSLLQKMNQFIQSFS